MNMKADFSDTILLKITREFTKDEAVKYLISEVRELKFRIGELGSENAELKDQNTALIHSGNKWLKKRNTELAATINRLKERIKVLEGK